jgi:molybdopterin converting factor small subunit
VPNPQAEADVIREDHAMAITDDLRKTLSNPTPLYFAAGTAELAYQQAKKVPGIVEQLRAEAPARFEAVRNTDPKDVQEKAAGRAKEAQAAIQAKVNEVLGTLDTDLKKIGETAQDLALRGVGVAAEYAVKARETYEKVAEHGEETVRAWRGDAADEILEVAEAVEPEAEPVAGQSAAAKPQPADASASKPVAAKKAPAKKTTTVKKTTPSAK